MTLDLVYVGKLQRGRRVEHLLPQRVPEPGASGSARTRSPGIYYMKVARGEDIPRVAAAIDQMFENSDAPTKTLTEKQFQLQFMEMMGNVKGLIHGISLVILFAVTLIVANTVAMSARERVTEIAVMRTLGFRAAHILAFILSESVLMSLLGGILGVLLAKYRLHPGHGRRECRRRRWRPSSSTSRSRGRSSLAAFGVSVGVGILAGFVPAIRSSQVKIVDGLRQVVVRMADPAQVQHSRNLFGRAKVSTGMTVFVICLVVTVFLFVLALVAGRHADALGDRLGPQRHHDARGLAGRDAERHHARRRPSMIRSLPGIERNAGGRALRLAGAPRRSSTSRATDGKTHQRPGARHGPDRHRDAAGVRIVDGRMFRPGTNEAIVSKNLASRFAGMKIGDTLKTGSLPLGRSSGYFDASGSAYESEIWTDVDGPPGADQAPDLLARLRAHDATRTPRRATSRRSRGTSA